MPHPVQEVLESLYAAARCPRLHINALADGVECPGHVRDRWRERLVIDLDPAYPLGLVYEREGVAVDLSFGGAVTRCRFPWRSIYIVADRATGRGIKIEQNLPASTPDEPGPAAVRSGPVASAAPQPDDADAVSESDADAEGPVDAAVDAASESSAQKRRAAFRVIEGGA